MPSVVDQASYNSNRIQKAYKINGIENTRLLRRLQLIEKEKLHKIRLTNRDIKIVSLMYENIHASSGHSPEGLPPEHIAINEEEEFEACFLYGERTTSRRFGKRRKRKQIDMRATKSEDVASEAFSDTSSVLRRVQSAATLRARRDSLASDNLEESLRPRSSSGIRSRFRFTTEVESTGNTESRHVTPWEGIQSRLGTPHHVWAQQQPELPKSPDKWSQQPDIDVEDFKPILNRKTSISSSDFVQTTKRRPSKSAPCLKNAKIIDIVNQVRLASSAAKKWKLAAVKHVNNTQEADIVIENTKTVKSEKIREERKVLNLRRVSIVEDKCSSYLDNHPLKAKSPVTIHELTNNIEQMKVGSTVL